MATTTPSEPLVPTPDGTKDPDSNLPADAPSDSATIDQGTFTLFPKLPVELRLHIWNVAREPRIVEVRFYHDRRKNKHKYITQQPVLLQVCQQSRKEALKWYQKVFRSRWALNRVGFDSVYFDFDLDILFINCPRKQEQLMTYLNRQKETDGLTLVRRLAIPQSSCRYIAEIIAKFSKLDELMVTTNCWTVPHDSRTMCSWPGIGLHDVEEVEAMDAKRGHLAFSLAIARCIFSEVEQVRMF